ncbi:ATP-binding protein [Bacteroides acidifaciens]|uniref:ATP-binding protein n=1 Tax=Bacteroides acidifaciens TaxID=85831 RepID=UPI002557E561|nr:ATP-binding protein [Bacteroides acidifaciens]
MQFENTEIQEYLAAKELCRQDNIESVLYDVAVQQRLRHIYPNWYDVIPHISYSDNRIQTFINVFKLIVSYESNLDNKSFENLLKYVDSSVLSLQQKEDLFSIIFEHYQRIPVYIMWRGPISQLLQECYTTGCDVQMLLPFEHLNKIQLSNIYVILDAIVENNNLSKCVSDYWINAANDLMATNDDEKKLAALNLYNALKCKDELTQLSKSYNGFSKELKEKYCEVTGYGKIVETDVVDCWLNDCYTGNPYAINAVLYIEDLTTIIYAYNKILDDDKLYEFFNKKEALVVRYELYLKKQFYIAWDGNTDSRQLITRIIAGFISNHLYTTHSIINVAVKQILLEEATGAMFIASFDRKWVLRKLLQHFDSELIDIELVLSLDKLLPEEKSVIGNKDHILTTLIYKIRNDTGKKASIKDYVERYSETFERWDKESSEIENEKVNSQNQQLIEAYQNISDLSVSLYDRYEAAFELSNNIEFVRKQNHQPLIDVIKRLFNELDLDKITVERNAHNSFTLHLSLPKIPCFVKILYYLGYKDLLNGYRIILAKTLPNICVTRNYDTCEIKEIYKSVIGDISDDEKKQLVEWWKSREDDFMDISSDDICSCITDYGIEALSYKLEEYIEQYKANQNLDYSIAASKALDVISDYSYWGIDKYRNLFDSLKDDGITSIKMKCNAIMIEKFKDADAIKWRIEYLKNNVVKSLHSDTGHARPISYEESEMISPNPYMFRCFMNIKDDETLTRQMLELFDFGLVLCENFDTQEYAHYLLNQIYLFFVSINNIGYISILRKKVEDHNAENVSYLATSIMNNAEMMFLINEKVSIGRAVKQYNKCIEESYLNIRNDGDLRRYFTEIHSEVQKEIQDQGIYTLVRPDALSEDFIQRELKNTIINKCCQMGLEAVRVDREVTLQDNKRTDLLIRYGLCNPIMVELKLLHNKEIQEKKKRQEYRKKFIQYTNATGACLSVFWVFDVHRENSKRLEFEDLKLEYKDLPHTSVLLTDCKCSSGIETGLSKKQTSLKDSKASCNKKVKGKKGKY